MAVGLDARRIEELVRSYLASGAVVPVRMYGQLAEYLALLVKWNAKTNLTAIREPEEMVRRHFGESLFAAQHLGECETVMDFGSGGGFPGVPMQLFRPELEVTLAESQNKKATFLREVVRILGLPAEVWAGRVEEMPADWRFDVVAMRAVDNMGLAVEVGAERSSKRVMVLGTERQEVRVPEGFEVEGAIGMPGSVDMRVLMLRRVAGCGDCSTWNNWGGKPLWAP